MELGLQIENLFRRDRNKLVGYIRERVRSKEEAEDILQDVFANVLTAATEVTEPIENVGAWVYTAVRNRIIDSYRKKRPQTFTDTIYSDDDGDIAAFENFLSDLSFSPERSLLSRTIREAVNAALDELPPEQKYAFVKTNLRGSASVRWPRKRGKISTHCWPANATQCFTCGNASKICTKVCKTNQGLCVIGGNQQRDHRVPTKRIVQKRNHGAERIQSKKGDVILHRRGHSCACADGVFGRLLGGCSRLRR